jgi:hypothetical protein
MRRWREVQAEVAEELTLLQKELEDLRTLHSNSTVPPSAVVGATCRTCQTGQYRERSVMDDINGTLTCSNCLDRIDRAA